MKVVILGANGFLGLHLYNYLKQKNNVLKCGRSKDHDIILKKIVKDKFFRSFTKKYSRCYYKFNSFNKCRYM